eukprot:1681368-Amphidinium_carterae.1
MEPTPPYEEDRKDPANDGDGRRERWEAQNIDARSRSRDDSQSDSSNGEDDDEDDTQGTKRERSESGGSHTEDNIRQRLEDAIDENAEEELLQVFLQRLNPQVIKQTTEKVAENHRTHATQESRVHMDLSMRQNGLNHSHCH